MAAIKSFEDMIVWQQSKVLCGEVYRSFGGCKDYAFRDQIQRAAVSVMNNIAEGFERSGDREFRKFLFIAKGSSGEVRSMITLAIDLGYLNQDEAAILSQQAISISKMLSTFIKRLSS